MYLQQVTYRPSLRRPSATPSTRQRTSGTPVATNIRETEAAFELHLLAPGRVKESFHLAVSPANVLTVSYQTPADSEPWLHQEFQLRPFERSFRLADSVDAAKIEAVYADGILKVTLPKKASAEQPVLEIPVA